MLRKNNAARLQATVTGVETMTRFALAVLSLASGVYTYLGVRGLLDGTATFVFFAAIIYSAAVSVALTRQMLWQYSAAPHPFELLQMDGPLSVELGAGADVKEGVSAFLEKRKPQFPGKVSKDIPPGYKQAKR